MADLSTILWCIPLMIAVAAVLLFTNDKPPAANPPGRCFHCGYDLRATPDRCPECGGEVFGDQ